MAKEYLKIGDEVNWRSNWGTDLPKKAIVNEIEICAVGAKHGKPVKKVSWETINKGKVVVTLDNGHWAYGKQLDK